VQGASHAARGTSTRPLLLLLLLLVGAAGSGVLPLLPLLLALLLLPLQAPVVAASAAVPLLSEHPQPCGDAAERVAMRRRCRWC
jgi:hypothetical protein